MKTIKEKAQWASELIKELADIALEHPFISFSETNKCLAIHVNGVDNLAKIGDYEISNFDLKDFQYKASVVLDGVEFFTLLTEKEYKKLFVLEKGEV